MGTPGADIGIQDEDPTLAELLKPLGYATGQFGKNHLGDKDKYLPTRHGFDEFFGNLYHLNAEEEPENPDYPKDPAFRKANGPRGVLHSFADGKIEDTGPLNKKRMETVDEEFLQGSLDFMERAVKAEKPFFTWFNSTRMHFYTHIKPESKGISGQNFYGDGMVEHDGHVGQLLDKLEELGVADNTIVVYTTDNGPHFNAWPDAGLSPFRGEKNTNWEGGYRVPAIVRWPGVVKPGTISHEIMSHLDWVPTLMAAAGDPKIKQKLMAGHTTGEKTFKVYLDGYDFMPYFTGKTEKGPRENFFYFSDDGLLTGLRHEDWKFVFAEQRSKTFDVWSDPFVILRIPKVFHLRRDPFERADTDSNTYNDWWIRHAPLIFHARPVITRFVFSFQRFPQRQRPASFHGRSDHGSVGQVFHGRLVCFAGRSFDVEQLVVDAPPAVVFYQRQSV